MLTVVLLFVSPIWSQENLNSTNATTDFALRNPLKIFGVQENPTLESIKDIAYYLRGHKFNEYDRRYEKNPNSAQRTYYKHFPRPPLRSLHWEVRQYCEQNFSSCIDYLGKKLKFTALKRTDDTSFVIQEQRWDRVSDAEKYKQVDTECEKMRKIDDTMADPFAGPLERFQWRSTASYYMCWYTMEEITELEHFGEPCDNFAACLDREFGPNNYDIRANDSTSFACAVYSFCPDPCCPLKHLKRLEDCWEYDENPCSRFNTASERSCSLQLASNVEFNDLILNRWNVSCNCPQKGYNWSSLYGFCVDIDECEYSAKHKCNTKSEACLNLAGGYKCVCQWGYVWSTKLQKCVRSAVLELIQVEEETKSTNKTEGFFKRFLKVFTKSNGNSNSIRFNQQVFMYLAAFVGCFL